MSNVKKLDTGLIVIGNRKIAYDNGTSIYIETTARRDFTAVDHSAFDTLVYADQKKPKIYVGSLKTQFDWKTQFDNFMKGEFPEGIEFSQEETKVLQTLEDIKTKIKAAFELPTVPYKPVEGIDLKKRFPSADETTLINYSAWLNGEGNGAAAPYGLQRQGIFLRLHTTAGGKQFVYSSSGNKLGVRTFEKVFNDFLKPYWSGERTNRWGPTTAGYGTEVSTNSATIGCHRDIPRSEIERIAKQLNLI